MDNQTEQKIKSDMAKYEKDQFNLYAAEAGWQDWMEEYDQNSPDEFLDEESASKIESIQINLWSEVHGD